MLRTGLDKMFMFCRLGLGGRKARRAAKRPSKSKAWSFEQLEKRDFLSASGLLVATSSVLQSTQPTANPHQNVALVDYVYGSYASGHNSTSASGNVNYYDNGNYLGSANLVGTSYGYSVATLNTSNLTSGSHTIRAAFGGMSNFLASSAMTTEFITMVPAQTTSSLSLSSRTTIFGQSLTITDSVFASYYAGSPYGSVSFYDNGSLLGTASLSNYGLGIAEAKLTTSALNVGQNSITAVYGGNTGFQASNASPVTEAVKVVPGTSGNYQGVPYVVYAGYVQVSGTLAWRDNNPGNLAAGQFATAHGAIGVDGVFAVFPTEQAGWNAMIANLQTPAYRSLTLSGAIARWAPPSQNNTAVYLAFVSAHSGVSPNTPMSSLSSAQLNAVALAMEKFEGSTVGYTYYAGDKTAPAWVQTLLNG